MQNMPIAQAGCKRGQRSAEIILAFTLLLYTVFEFGFCYCHPKSACLFAGFDAGRLFLLLTFSYVKDTLDRHSAAANSLSSNGSRLPSKKKHSPLPSGGGTSIGKSV